MAGLVSTAMQPPVQPQGQQVAPESQVAAPAGAPSPGIPQGVENPGSNLKNPTLNQIETGVEQKIDPKYQQMYKSIVMASMDLAFNPKTHGQLVKGLQSSPDIPKNVALIVAGMIGIVFQKSGQDPNAFVPAAMPASITIMCQILEFAEQSGMVKLTDDDIAKCTGLTSQAVLRKFGVDGNKLNQAVQAKGRPQGLVSSAQQAPQQASQQAPQGAQVQPMGA